MSQHLSDVPQFDVGVLGKGPIGSTVVGDDPTVIRQAPTKSRGAVL